MAHRQDDGECPPPAINHEIHDTEAKLSDVSASLSRDLPARLFRRKTVQAAAAIDPAEIHRRAELQAAKGEQLRRGCWGQRRALTPRGWSRRSWRSCTPALQDNKKKKLAVFKDLADRAEILLDILNRKLAPKQVQRSRRRVRVQDPRWAGAGAQPAVLGEQHELVLLHSLLFRVERGALLLIRRAPSCPTARHLADRLWKT